MSVTVTAPATFTTTVTSNAAAATIASASTTGTAKFNTDNFAVSGAGDVTIKDAGVLLTAEVTGTLPIANGGTGATSAAMVGIITAANASAARTVLELVPGTSANQIVQMTAAGKLPAVDGSDLTNLAASPTFGISNTNAVKVDSASVANGEYAKFTASGLESKTTGEVLTDIGAAAASHNQSATTITSGTLGVDRIPALSTDKLTSGTLPVGRGGTGLTAVTTLLNSNQAYSDISGTPTLGTAAALAVGISNTNILQANAAVSDDDFLRVAGTQIEGRTAAETLSDIGAQAALTFGKSSGNSIKSEAALDTNDFLRVGTTHVVGRTNAEVLSDIGAQAADADLTAIAGLTSAADKGIQFTGSGSAAVYDLTAAGKALLDDADAAAQRTTLGLGTAALVATGTGDANAILGNDARLTDDRDPNAHSTDKLTSGTLPVGRGGTGLTSVSTLLNSNTTKSDVGLGNVTNIVAQPVDADLTAIAGLTSAADKGIQFTGSGTAAVYDLTAAGKALLDDADAAAQRTTLGLGTAATSATGDFAAAAHNQSATTITSGTLAVARGGTGVTSLPMVTIPGAADAAAARVVLGVTNVGSYTGQIETVADKTYTLDPGAATARTISGFYIKSASGTVTATLKVGTAVVKAASVTSSTGDQSSLANTSVSANNVITLVCSSNSSALDVIFAVEYTE